MQTPIEREYIEAALLNSVFCKFRRKASKTTRLKYHHSLREVVKQNSLVPLRILPYYADLPLAVDPYVYDVMYSVNYTRSFASL